MRVIVDDQDSDRKGLGDTHNITFLWFQNEAGRRHIVDDLNYDLKLVESLKFLVNVLPYSPRCLAVSIVSDPLPGRRFNL